MVFKYVRAILIITTWFNFIALLWYALLFQNWAALIQAVWMLLIVAVIGSIGYKKEG